MANDTPMSCRSLLAISAAAVAGTAAVGTSGALAQAIQPDPDAHLIDLCAQWQDLRLDYARTRHDRERAEEAAVDKYQHLGMPALWAEVHRDPAYREADERTSASWAGCTPSTRL